MLDCHLVIKLWSQSVISDRYAALTRNVLEKDAKLHDRTIAYM